MAVPAPFANRIIVDTDRDDLDTTRFEYRDYVFAELGIVCNSVRHNHENAPLVSDAINEISDRRHSFASRGAIACQLPVIPTFSAGDALGLFASLEAEEGNPRRNSRRAVQRCFDTGVTGRFVHG